ncbi:triphosphoribosyl-dephospho-CoA synthase MdcB [Massilia sp. PWRC2]|uniref:triphosphoribosyl-dephospho-CoA synthase MdcB n=1 Tax=Massilia sp. PWRC2 TaxID=2804626 RepID=UPI003CEF975E
MTALATPALRFDVLAARWALGALHAELLLYPKPGLVSLIDNGSHTDMNAATFMRSLFSLRHYFAAISRAGAAAAPFSVLRQLGQHAELRMLAATGGINTHRGAIFSLGLLCAAFGRLRAAHAGSAVSSIDAAALRGALTSWRAELAAHVNAAPPGATSHGVLVARRHHAGGAREEGARGLPMVFEVGLPALRRTLAAGASMQAARIDALFALMATIGDTNVLHRGGADGAQLVRSTARAFIDAGGSAAPDWRARALAAHRLFVGRRLSPGGAADLLAATCLVQAMTSGAAP